MNRFHDIDRYPEDHEDYSDLDETGIVASSLAVMCFALSIGLILWVML